MTRRISVRVPASTANLGPGFDCLGLALSLYNTVTMEDTGAGLNVEVFGESADTIPRGANNLVVRALDSAFEAAGVDRPATLQIRCENGVPVGSGLGSSAAAVVGGVMAANAWMDGRFDRAALLNLAVGLEGHPDNVAAALMGGLVLVSGAEGGLVSRSIPIPAVRVAIALPVFALSTHAMRAVLPAQVPLSDAVSNIGRAALVIEALREADYGLLSRVMQDRLHVPYRKHLIPGYDAVVLAAHRAGAAAVTLSGAGPAVAAFAPYRHEQIAEAMVGAFRGAGLDARAWVLDVDLQGAILSG